MMFTEDDLKVIEGLVTTARKVVKQLKIDAKDQVVQAHELGKTLQDIQQDVKKMKNFIDTSKTDKADKLLLGIREALTKFDEKEIEINNG